MSRKENVIEITDKIIETILHHQHRTGVGPQKLLRGKRDVVPAGLSSSSVYNWIQRRAKTARKNHLDFILEEWSKLPDNPYANKRYKNYREGLEPIDPENLRKLQAIRDMTGLLPSKIFTQTKDSPSYLNANIVNQWLCVDGYKARPEDVKWVLKASKQILNTCLETIK